MLGDEAMLQADLTASLAGKWRAYHLKMLAGDCLYDAYRERPWFKALLAAQGSPGEPDAPADRF